MRQVINFNAGWFFTKPGCEKQAVSLPHTWNATDGQDGGNDYFRGTCIYEKAFARPAGEKVYLEFCGAAMIADVFVNDIKLCHHEGGYSSFWVDITDVLQAQNIVRVELNNEENNFCYPQKADFTFYGGLYRDVRLLCLPKNHLGQVHVTPIVNGTGASVTLLVDGVEFGTKPCDKAVTFVVPITGRHEITAIRGDYRDSITINRVSEPNAEYFMGNVVKVVNWFDKDTYDPNFYSVKDKFGTLMAEPRTRHIIGPMMEAAIANRGDVAKSANQNKNLQNMLAGMTMEGLLKMAGDTISSEQAAELNAALQRIPKE